MRRFYLRRTLRIFPLYYFAIVMALAFAPQPAREQLPWLASYTYNIWISALGWWPPYFSHFWSLCVEEQFYLLWPWVVLYAPWRGLKGLALAVILAGPMYRWMAVELELSNVAIYAFTLSSMDALGMGALLAVVSRGRIAEQRVEVGLRWIAFPLGVAGLAVLHTIDVHAGIKLPQVVLFDTFAALVFVWLVAAASRGIGGLGNALLGTRPIVYLGTVSYGVYVYHLFMPDLLRPAFALFGIYIAPKGVTEFLIVSMATVATAIASWHLMERPIIAFGKTQISSRSRIK